MKVRGEAGTAGVRSCWRIIWTKESQPTAQHTTRGGMAKGKKYTPAVDGEATGVALEGAAVPIAAGYHRQRGARAYQEDGCIIVEDLNGTSRPRARCWGVPPECGGGVVVGRAGFYCRLPLPLTLLLFLSLFFFHCQPW